MSSIKRQTVLETIDSWLQPEQISDYCPNGLQVEGRTDIRRMLCGVTACEALIDQAIAQQADAMLVHHGYFWKGEQAVITGMKKQRLTKLLSHDINLLAYHLPLDIHPELGNNAGLAKQLELSVNGQKAAAGTAGLLWHGALPRAMSAGELTEFITSKLGRKPLLVAPANRDENSKYRTIAWCSGGAQSLIANAAELGSEIYLSGEISEQTVHSARELGVCYIAAGHHATERYGVQLLGAALQKNLGLQVWFEDIPNPA